MSKSNPDVAKLCYEGHYIEYAYNTIVRSRNHYLSFVRGENIISCVSYGDQLTEIILDPMHPLYDQIADAEMQTVPSGLGELRSNAVIAGKSYSLSEPDTIQKIIGMTPEPKLKLIAETDSLNYYNSVARHLKKLGFYRSLDFWNSRMEEYKRLTWQEIDQRVLEKNIF